MTTPRPRAATDTRTLLRRIAALAPRDPIRILNVCGGHERTIARAGLRALLPRTIELVPGPGCPVCVCPEEDIYRAIQLACHEGVRLLTFGDLLRTPVNLGRRAIRTLAQARSAGADVRAIASPLEAVAEARRAPQRPCVFFAAGFETTMAPVAAMLAEGVPANLSVLLSGRRTWPVVAALLGTKTTTGPAAFDGLIAPGHVATVMGAEEWRFVAEAHGLPTAIAGFDAHGLLLALGAVLRQRADGEARLTNCYGEVVRRRGNRLAQRVMAEVMTVEDASWRGIGVIPASGFGLQAAYAGHDARRRWPGPETVRPRAGEMPPGCDCAAVLLGRCYPDQCRLYGGACTPETPVGPCMVSDEGACHIWWQAGVRTRTPAHAG